MIWKNVDEPKVAFPQHIPPPTDTRMNISHWAKC